MEFFEKNVILFVLIGSGKIEFGLNWVFKSKFIYIFLICVFINVMYERLVKIFGEDKVGILYLDSMIYLFEKYLNLECEN